MALEIRQNLKLSQQLIITPQLQQSIKLLQLSRLELLEMVRGEILENPVLEEEVESEEIKPQEIKAQEFTDNENAPEKKVDHESQEVMTVQEGEIKEPNDFDWDNYINTYSSPERISSASETEESPTYENTLSGKASLSDHLLWQLHLSDFSEEEEEIGSLLIGSINEDGYLQDPLEEIAEKAKVPLEKVEAVLGRIQRFDPPGVGARDLKECLLLQIRFCGEEHQALEDLISHHLPELERKDFKKIAKEMHLEINEVLRLAKLLHELDPKPGRPYSQSSAEYITPDVQVCKVGDEWVVVLNEDGLPKLQVSSFYRNMIKKPDSGGKAKEYIQGKLKSALWLIRSIHQRQRTLYKVVKTIVKFQKDFFEKGVEHLKPMILRDVAEEVSMHESTISRVTTNKYVHTPRGIFELKYFFNNGVLNPDGDSVASEVIKNKIHQLISQENVKSPYSDQDLVGLLKENNINIARRTIAKYREMLGILSSSKRRQLF